jgi:hypothetical protein
MAFFVFMASISMAGCADSAASTPSPSPTPMFESDDDAFEVAVAAYQRYLEVYTSISSDGGAGSERILEVAGTDHANELLAEFRAMKEAGIHTTGAGEVLAPRLSQSDPMRKELELQLCLGVGDSRFFDAHGTDVTPNRDAATPLVVSLTAVRPDDVVVTGSVLWPGDTFC